ncbi:MAG: NfeD family protein [Deltaproteobacteria bacterium]|jgi:membrane protein implicated in regulation of membrane protease activity|nr:NfeD family protein [Deltaproteobacteria bacterium]
MPDLPLLEPIWWNWYLGGLALACLELLLPGSYLLWIGLGALLTGALTHIAGGFYWPWQILAFSILSLFSLLVGRRLIRRGRSSSRSSLNQRQRGCLGRQGVLVAPISGGYGRVRLDGVYWYVRGPDLPEGTLVTVTGVEGATLIVEKADPAS